MNQSFEKLSLMDASELSTLLKCSKKTIYNLVSKDDIPHLKLKGIGLRFNYQDIENWILEEGGL